MQHHTSRRLPKVWSTCKYHSDITRARHVLPREGQGGPDTDSQRGRCGLRLPCPLAHPRRRAGKTRKTVSSHKTQQYPRGIHLKETGQMHTAFYQQLTSGWEERYSAPVRRCSTHSIPRYTREPPRVKQLRTRDCSIPSTFLQQEPLKSLLYSQREARKSRFVPSTNWCSHGKLHQSAVQRRYELEPEEQEEWHLQGKWIE